MKNTNKLLLMTAALTTVAASAIILANQNDSTLFQPIAGPRYSNERSITLNGESPKISIDNNKVGRLVVGNIGIYSPYCRALDGGVVTLLEDNYLYIYCATSELGPDNKQKGFSGSRVTSIHLTINNHGKLDDHSELKLRWITLTGTDNFVKTEGGVDNIKTFSLVNTTINQTMQTYEDDNFIANQEEDFDCIGLYHKDGRNADLDIFSITINYECK